ncbi:hypothetical protein BX616_000814, partial [Lobosporangium transversale]
ATAMAGSCEQNRFLDWRKGFRSERGKGRMTTSRKALLRCQCGENNDEVDQQWNLNVCSSEFGRNMIYCFRISETHCPIDDQDEIKFERLCLERGNDCFVSTCYIGHH